MLSSRGLPDLEIKSVSPAALVLQVGSPPLPGSPLIIQENFSIYTKGLG